jgi:hypothetical protein
VGINVDTIKEDTEILIDVSKEVGLEVNTETIKYMLLSHHRNTGQNHDINITSKSFENMEQFNYLGMSVRN